MLPVITLSRSARENEPVICIGFAFDRQLIDVIKQKTGAAWSRSLGSWYIRESEFQLNRFFNDMKSVAYIDYTKIQDNGRSAGGIPEKQKADIALPAGYSERLEQERYSEYTIKTYTHYFRDFISTFAGKELQQVTKEEINAYILKLIREKNISASQQNQRINAIKFYYEKVLRNERQVFEIERPRKENYCQKF